MRSVLKSLCAVSILAAPLLAGALRIEVANPAANQEALSKNAVLVTQVTACHSPENTTVTATAEGVVNGTRKSIALKVIRLSTPGMFAISREWPTDGVWVVKMVAANPDYQNYAASAVVPIQKSSVRLGEVRRYYHVPTEAEVLMSLN